MKTIFKLIPLVSVAVFGACNDIIESAEAISIPEKEIVLTATREGVNPGTKSFRLDDGSVWWSPAEEVSVFYGSGSNGGSKFVSMNTAIAETVELQGSVQMAGSGKDFWAVYPYSEENSCDGNSITTVIPDQQTGVKGNFSNDAFPTVAKSSSLSLAFWNICGGIKFFVSRNDIKSVTFKGNNNEPLAGKVRVSFGTDGTPVVQEVIDAKAEVTLVAPDGGTFKVGEYYYISVLPAALQNGFTMTFHKADSKGIVTSNNAQTVKRSTFGVLKNIDAKVPEWERTVVESEWVDLGLSVKWATCNVGATKPEEYGNYFAWGELNPKSVYDVSTYNYFSNGEYKCTKYCPKYQTYYWNGQGEPDNKTVLDPEDDVAHVLLGDKWRIPTLEEKNELINNCSLTWTSNYNGTGVAGMIVTSKMTGFTDKSIFLPASGSRSGTSINGFGTNCNYWSSSLDINTPPNAYGLSYYSPSNIFWDGATRSVGCSVRPVYGEPTIKFTLTLNVNYLELIVGNSAYLSAVITPSNYYSESSVRWASRDDTIVSVDQSGSIVALKEGSTVIDAYSSNGLSASCTIVVRAEKFPEPEAVDFGLSVKWASFNLGASKPEEYGDYFAWGETEPYYIEGYAHSSPCFYWKSGKYSGYTWTSYKYANDDYKKLTKYCTLNSYWGGSGSPDRLTNFSQTNPPYIDDAARTILGSEWRIPTKSEWEELCKNCSWLWTNDFKGTGIQGYIVTRSSYTDKFIFLPATGERYEGD